MIGASRWLFAGIVAGVYQQEVAAQVVVTNNPQVSVRQVLDLGVVFNWRAVLETIEELCSAEGIRAGAPSLPLIDPSAVEIVQEDQVPPRPDIV